MLDLANVAIYLDAVRTDRTAARYLMNSYGSEAPHFESRMLSAER